jgi:TldD protein
MMREVTFMDIADHLTPDDGMESSIQALLDRQPVDYVELRLEVNEATVIELTGTVRRRVDHQVDVGGNVRAVSGGYAGFVHFDGWEHMESRVAEAVLLAKTAEAASIGPRESWAPSQVVHLRNRVPYGENPRGVTTEDKVALLQGYADKGLSADPAIKTVQTRYFDRYRHLWFFNSRGSVVEQEKLDLGGAIMMVARRDGAVAQRGVSFGSSNDFGAVRGLDAAVREAAARAVHLLEAEELVGGEYTVVIDPHLAGVFAHEAFGHLSEADGQVEDAGILKAMQLGRKFGPKNLHIYDTGFDEGSRGYLPVDDEGVPARDIDLIKDGELVGRLHSQRTAARMNEAPTGNARALHYRFAPIVRMRNTVIAAGDTPVGDLFQGIKRGIYAAGSTGGQTNGELFAFRAAEAYLIEDGQITKPLRSAVLTGNVFSTLNQISAIGNDFTRFESGGGCGKAGQMPLPVSHHAPSLRIERCLVGGAR